MVIGTAHDACSQVTIRYTDSATMVLWECEHIVTDMDRHRRLRQHFQLRADDHGPRYDPANDYSSARRHAGVRRQHFPSATGTATAWDGCSGVTVTYSDSVSNSCGGSKVISRTWTATDQCGNIARALQTITTRDTMPRRLGCRPT